MLLSTLIAHSFFNQEKPWIQRWLKNKSVEHLLHAAVVTVCLLYAYDITPTIGIQVTSKVGLEFLKSINK